jgi:ammonia channel protein AmtB
MMCIATSCVVNEMLHVRDVVEGSIAGAVACASASFYLVNPVYALVIGSVSGVVQALAQNMIEKRSSRTRNILNTFSFVTFGVQGMLGSAFASLFRAVLEGDANRNHAISDHSYTTSYLNAPVFDFVSGIISGTMGTLIGVLMGVVLLLVAKHSHRREHFHDFVYWINDDGIRYSKKKTDISLTEPKLEPIAEEKE